MFAGNTPANRGRGIGGPKVTFGLGRVTVESAVRGMFGLSVVVPGTDCPVEGWPTDESAVVGAVYRLCPLPFLVYATCVLLP